MLFMFMLSLSIGNYEIELKEVLRILFGQIFPIPVTWNKIQSAVVLTLRLPRSIAAIMIGGGLALAGASYQSLFKNPMVSPDLLGVTGGACVGAAAAILLNANSVEIQLAAFTGGCAAVLMTISIPKLIRNNTITVLVLSGIIVSSLMTSLISVLKFVADVDTKLGEITYWIMGSLAHLTLKDIGGVLPTMLLPALIIVLLRFRLNVMSLGDAEAKTLGINVGANRALIILSSTLLTASAVCLAGSIGWVGLVIPHVSRMITGSDNKKMLPIALVLGAIFMLVIDIIARNATSAELPIGVLTGIIGAPFFFFILYKQRRSIS